MPADIGLAQHEGQEDDKGEPHVAAGQQQGEGKAMNAQHLVHRGHGVDLRPKATCKTHEPATTVHPSVYEIHACGVRACW